MGYSPCRIAEAVRGCRLLAEAYLKLRQPGYLDAALAACDKGLQRSVIDDRLRDELEVRRAAIRIPALADVADRYLEALRG